MKKLTAAGCLLAVVGLAWMSGAGQNQTAGGGGWSEVAPGVLRSAGLPAGYALIAGDRALLIDAPADPAGLRARGVKKIGGTLLTHHHRDTCAAAGKLLRDGVPVRAPKVSAEWLTPEKVAEYWKESIPLRHSRTAYLVVPEGLKGVDCSLKDGQTVTWNGWTIRVLATPGHSLDHVAFVASRGGAGKRLLFCGDAFAEPGKLWTPYTTDWDHWTDAGLKPAAASLRKLIAEKADVLLPAHGPVINAGVEDALKKTEAAVAEMGFLKSFERFTKQRLGNAPQYRFLAKEQAESNGSKPWTQVSEHLFLTGNTYVLTAKTGEFLVVDPWAERSAKQVLKLQRDRRLGPMEVVLFSHAHYDHYDGVYDLPDRDRFQVWTLDRVATPIAEPFLLRAPFLDARPVRIDRRLKEGETVTWRDYRFRIHYLPGQSEFTMGVETEIDGKRCLFTADNWFHQDMFSGSGGWMGLNRSWPGYYAASAKKVLDLAPEWVLAEHGGPFEFNAEDFRRRVRWGEVGAKAADALCVSGNHRLDWDPHRVHVEPLVVKGRPGDVLKASLAAHNPLGRRVKWAVRLEGRGVIPDATWELDIPSSGTVRRGFEVLLPDGLPAGRHVFAVTARQGDRIDGSDAFFAVDVTP
jgi:glyoxylase-like metal-dependent hydrolase (beta-lactamase superfamily II)